MEKYGIDTIHYSKYLGYYKIIDKKPNKGRIVLALDTLEKYNFSTHQLIDENFGKPVVRKYKVGDIFTNKNKESVVILEILKNKKAKIKFLDTYGYSYDLDFSGIRNKTFKNPYRKTISDVGYLGVGFYNSKNSKKAYTCWSHIIKRCYDKKFIKNSNSNLSSYEKVYMCEEWKNFQVFAEWYNKNIPTIKGIKFELDKDLLQKNIEYKCYSPETCIFLPSRINKFLITSNHKNKTSKYIGVCRDKNKYLAGCSNFNTGKTDFIKFDSEEDAYEKYKEMKNKNIILAINYLDNLKLNSISELINIYFSS